VKLKGKGKLSFVEHEEERDLDMFIQGKGNLEDLLNAKDPTAYRNRISEKQITHKFTATDSMKPTLDVTRTYDNLADETSSTQKILSAQKMDSQTIYNYAQQPV